MEARFGLGFNLTRILCASTVVSVWFAAGLHAAPRVAGFERFAAGPNDSAAFGRLLVQELNCLSCHRTESSATAVAPKQAPVLEDVGSRIRPEWFRAFLANPHAVKPGTTMPHLLASMPEPERTAAAEALTHFLASTGAVADSHPDPTSAKRGQGLFQRIGCLACHPAPGNDGVDLPTSVPLPDLGKKYTAASLAAFLKDPLKTRPSGRMPAFGLKDEEYRDLGQFFVRDVTLSPTVKFTAYHGNWVKLPDFNTLKPTKTGQCAGFDLAVAGQPDNYAIRFETNLFIKAPVQHQYYLGSDDGSRLTIGGQVILENDGIHAHEEIKGRHSFEVGWHPVVVEFMQGGGEASLDVDIEGNGMKRMPLAALVSLSTDKAPAETHSGLHIDATLAERGRELFQSVGCAACHQWKQEGKALAATKLAKPWSDLKTPEKNIDQGCLAEAPAAGLPRYEMTATQRRAIAQILGTTAPDTTPADSIHQSLLTFNCYACHKRGEVGGVEEARDAFFTSAQKEMGDEGRLPPALTGVGDKLRDEWMKRVLEQGADDRKLYMQAKMPKFGGRNVGRLVDAFAVVDRQPESAPNPAFTEPEYRVKAAGRRLVGGNALSCIKCHDFAQHPSQGVRAISLTTMTQRLREDWFHRYLLDPQAFRPGTRMPAPWPFGASTIRDVLGGQADVQIRAVWRYLADGDRAPVPVGLVREPIELKPQGTPILYRNFLEGAGSRAIGVGYPEHVNLAWDANNMRLALIWHGAFLDASRHWNGRGVGFEAPLGDDVLALPSGPPLARLDSVNASWPDGSARDNGFHFRGYRLDAHQRPVFQFSVESMNAEDSLLPALREGAKSPYLRRTVTLRGMDRDAVWYFRAAVAHKIESTSPGVYRIDGTWTLQVTSTEPAIVRDSQGRQELLIPVRTGQLPASLTLEYQW